jgi:hypothetical protein
MAFFVNAADTTLGRTPLWEAAFWGRVELVKLLVEAGARVDVRDLENQTALDAALEEMTEGELREDIRQSEELGCEEEDFHYLREKLEIVDMLRAHGATL